MLAVDWPGWGRSSRPPFPQGQGVKACEAFFVDHIEAWRQKLGLGRLVLLGHSFGGYFAACYTMKYPENVERLILASPVGMGPKKMTRFTDPAKRSELSFWQRCFVGLAEYLWEAGHTPQGIVRTLGPFGSSLTRWYVNRRFQKSREAGTMEVNEEAMEEYIHQLAAQPGCSEYCLSELLEFGAFARDPIASRLAEHLKLLGASAPPVSLIYGEHDWMDINSGIWLAKELRSAGTRLRDCGPQAQGPEVIKVHDAGHQLFLEHPAAFNAAVFRALGRGPPSAEGLYSLAFPE